MHLALRAKLALLSGAMALGGLTAAAPTAHAFPLGPWPERQLVAPLGQVSLGCTPTLTVTGDGFPKNLAAGGPLEVDLWQDGSPEPYNPFYPGTLFPATDGSGHFSVTFQLPPAVPIASWQAVAKTSGYLDSWSNTATCGFASLPLAPSSSQPAGGGGGGGGAAGHQPVVNPHKPNLQ